MIIKLLGFFIAIVFISLLIWQVSWPLIRGKPLFPLFRFKYRKARQSVMDAKEYEDLVSLSKKAVKIRTKAAKEELKTTLSIKDLDNEFEEITQEITKEETQERVRVKNEW